MSLIVSDNQVLFRAFKLYRALLTKLDRNIYIYFIFTIVIACLQIFIFAEVDVSGKLEACTISTVLAVVLVVFFLPLFKAFSYFSSKAGPVKFYDWSIGWSFIVKIFPVFLFAGAIFYIFNFPLQVDVMSERNLPPINWLPSILTIYFSLRKSEL